MASRAHCARDNESFFSGWCKNRNKSFYDFFILQFGQNYNVHGDDDNVNNDADDNAANDDADVNNGAIA